MAKYKNTAMFIGQPKDLPTFKRRTHTYTPELAGSTGVPTIKPTAPKLRKQPTDQGMPPEAGGPSVTAKGGPNTSIRLFQPTTKGRAFSETKAPRYNKQPTES